MEREEGYYWIRFDSLWMVAYWSDTVQWGWHFALWNTSQPVYEAEVDEIDETPLERSKGIEYAIIPVSFSSYNQMVDTMNDMGQKGWIFGPMIRQYNDSPMAGITTFDFVCHRVNPLKKPDK